VPDDAPNKALAVQFAAFLLGKSAQQASLTMVGSAVRKDLDVSALPAQSRPFAAPTWRLAAYDFPEASLVWYPELEAAFHRRLLGAIARPPADLKAFIAETAGEMRVMAKALSEKKG
jgi:ABC-type glycerol-3-phosphate transport system substrate-binding protein